jgi:hypothetical protein
MTISPIGGPFLDWLRVPLTRSGRGLSAQAATRLLPLYTTALKCLMISLLEIASVFFLLHRGAFDVGPYQRQSVPLHRLTPQSLWPSPARRIRLETTVVAAFSATRPASEDAKAKAGRTCLRDGRLLPRSGNHLPAPSQLAATDTSPEAEIKRFHHVLGHSYKPPPRRLPAPHGPGHVASVR